MEKKLLTAERRRELAQILVSEGSVQVGKLATYFGVTTETIRKDLIFLEKEGIAQKSHGGAVVRGTLLERPFDQKTKENQDAKRAIAKVASQNIPDKSTIILDAGSTTLELAQLLTLRSELTIFTNSLSILQTLAATQNQVYVLGGKIRANSMALVGGWTLGLLESIQADIAFLGTDGFAGRMGPCSASFEEIEVKKAIINSSNRRVLLCDHAKFMHSDMFQYAQWADIDEVLTDGAVSREEAERIGQHTRVTVL